MVFMGILMRLILFVSSAEKGLFLSGTFRAFCMAPGRAVNGLCLQAPGQFRCRNNGRRATCRESGPTMTITYLDQQI